MEQSFFKKVIIPVLLSFLVVLGFIFGWHYFKNMNIKLETEHFQFHSTVKDKKILGGLADELESNYERITKDLNLTVDEKITVRVYPNLKTYQSGVEVCNWTDTWRLFSTGQVKDIRLLSPQYQIVEWWDEDAANDSAVHSLVHVIMRKNSIYVGKMPMWLTEGIANYITYESKEEYFEKVRKTVRENEIPDFRILKMKTDKIILFFKASTPFYDNNGYEFSYTIIDFIISNYGRDKLDEIIRSHKNYLEILNMTDEEEFIREWTTFLEEKYR